MKNLFEYLVVTSVEIREVLSKYFRLLAKLNVLYIDCETSWPRRMRLFNYMPL